MSAEPPARITLSPVQILASVLAATSAAFVSSYFGVAGTVIGTALFSLVATVGTTLYSHSLTRTSVRLRQARSTLPADRLALLRRHPREATDAEPGPGRLRWDHVVITAVVVFAGAAGVVTAVELATRKPLAAIVPGGDRVGGTTTFGGVHVAPRARPQPSRSTSPTPASARPTASASATPPIGSPSPTGSSPPSPTPTATGPASPPPTGPGSPTPTP